MSLPSPRPRQELQRRSLCPPSILLLLPFPLLLLDPSLPRRPARPGLVPRRWPISPPRQLLPQALQRRRYVLAPRALVLPFSGHSGGQVHQAHRGLRFVAVLPPGPAGAVGLQLALREQLEVRQL